MNTTIMFYTQISKTYDLMNYVVYSRKLLNRIIKLAEIKEGDKVLDLACGTGWLSKELERLSVNTHAIDLTPAMLRKAKKRITGNFLIGKAETLPYRSGSFDVILCNMAFSHFEYHTVTKEINRVLKQGGRFVVTVSIDPMPTIYDAFVYCPARLIVKLLWIIAGCPSNKPSNNKSEITYPKPEDISVAFSEPLDAKIELRYDLFGPATRLKSGCGIIYGRKR
jgi:ubiquinone/menaquinone biosynthesis C-methylase UbiE